MRKKPKKFKIAECALGRLHCYHVFPKEGGQYYLTKLYVKKDKIKLLLPLCPLGIRLKSRITIQNKFDNTEDMWNFVGEMEVENAKEKEQHTERQ